MSNKNRGRCLVCGDISIGLNFGISTCMPCKAFFRRNALKSDTLEFTCKKDGNCIITYKHRRSCNCCRLTKCFRVGMNKELILSDETRVARNKLIETNRLKRGKVTQRPCVEWMKSPSLIRISKTSVQYLSSPDQVVLTNIFHAYENTCIVAKNTRFQTFPSVQHTSLHEYFNEMSIIFPVFIEYLKNIPEFVNINMDDKIRLIKHHFGAIVNLNQILMYRIIPTNYIVSWANVFGIDITERLLKRNQIFEQYMFDPILLKIVLIILVLSSDSGRNVTTSGIDVICDDPLVIFTAQNVYIELLWRYILSRTAHEKDAVKFLNKLLMCILYIKNLDIFIYDYVNRLQDEINQIEPMMKNMWSKENEEDDINIDV